MRILCARHAWVLAAGLMLGSAAWAQDQGKYVAPEGKGTFSLANYQGQGNQGTVVAESTKVTTTTTTMGRENIAGPISLRTSDPEPVGRLTVKNHFGWRTQRDNGDDDWSYELEVEYGLVENHELLFFVNPLHMGDGRIDGNGDTTLGWHWRLWQEDGLVPGTAIRQFVRIPTGDGSEGVDYELRGLFTWSVSDTSRFSINPYLRSVNGENDAVVTEDEDGDEVVEDPRHFRWGVIAGFDYDLSDDFKLIWDYVYGSSITEGHRDNHSFEMGFDWKFAENQTLAFVTEVSLDGDGNDNAALGAEISYILSFGG